MAEVIVDLLEAVEVDEHQRYALPAAGGVLDRGVQRAVEATPIQQTGEHIDIGFGGHPGQDADDDTHTEGHACRNQPGPPGQAGDNGPRGQHPEAQHHGERDMRKRLRPGEEQRRITGDEDIERGEADRADRVRERMHRDGHQDRRDGDVPVMNGMRQTRPPREQRESQRQRNRRSCTDQRSITLFPRCDGSNNQAKHTTHDVERPGGPSHDHSCRQRRCRPHPGSGIAARPDSSHGQ